MCQYDGDGARRDGDHWRRKGGNREEDGTTGGREGTVAMTTRQSNLMENEDDEAKIIGKC